MINGYVNIPSELTNVGTFFQPQTIPGIYNKMLSIASLNKPTVGKFSLAPAENVEAVFSPVCILLDGVIALQFTYGSLSIVLNVTENDRVYITE